nr:DEAD/DEAH box helicase [Legionella yabuuchiae]
MLKTAISRMEEVFSPIVLNQSHEYQAHGYVLNVRLSDGLIKARVKDSSNHIYNVHIDLKHWPKIPADCSCNTRNNCVHAAAAILALQAKEFNAKPQEVLSAPLYYAKEKVLEADDFEWFSSLGSSAQDFFSYQLGILIDGKQINIVPIVVDLISRWDAKTLENLSDNMEIKLPLSQGKSLKMSLGRIKPLLQLLLHYRVESAQELLKLKSHQLLLMIEAEQALAASTSRWMGTQALRQSLLQLSNLKYIPEVPVPAGLTAELRPYQKQGLSWLSCLRENQFGGVLADDMGLGKTIQTLGLLQLEKEQGRLDQACLIIAPTSLVGNWYEEAKRFTPDLRVLVFHGSSRHEDEFNHYDVVISTYGLIQRDKTRFLKYTFYYLILDEAQFIKNARTKTTQIIQQLKAQHRLCLTGTPLENHLGELWSLFNFLMPGLLGTPRQFRHQFKNPIEKEGSLERQKLLGLRLQPFLLRRTKSLVAKELPPKTETTYTIELAGPQRDLYEAIRLLMEKKVRDAIAAQGIGRSQIILLDALLKLRQVCCDPRLLTMVDAKMAYGHSAKMDALLTILENLMDEGRRVLIFSQFTSMLKLIEQELEAKQYDYLKLTGQSKNRTEIVNQFQEGKAPIFLISLKAGGTGLNLTQADTVIHYDPWWNPAVEDQATDRSHRIGQENPVFVYKLITAGTVEEAILKMQDNKRQLVEGILSNKATGSLSFSEHELEALFAPLS